MISTHQRIKQLATASQHPDFAELIGTVTEHDLCSWLSAELGRADALDDFASFGNIQSKAIAPNQILHIVSGNTPHAALQSLFRGILLGSENLIKVPSSGLPILDSWIEKLPAELQSNIRILSELTEMDFAGSDAVVAIGSDTTIQSIQSRIRPHQLFIPHGHKISIGVVLDDHENAAQLAARDISLFDQRGCLSIQAVYAKNAPEFAELLAREMQAFLEKNPPLTRSLSEAGAIRNFRETQRFAAANSEDISLWHSDDSLAWTVALKNTQTLSPSSLGCCVTVMPLADVLDATSLGEEAKFLSTIALHPFSVDAAINFTNLGAHRICPLGESQQPSLFWHHDGFAPLASLVKWQDIG